MNINAWCAGEYNGLTGIDNGTGRNGVIQVSNDVSTIGETSIKLTKQSSRWWCYIEFAGVLNKTYEINVDIYSPNNNSKLMLYGSDSTCISEVIIPQSDNWQNITLSGKLTDATAPYVRIQPINEEGNFCYFDNLIVREV